MTQRGEDVVPPAATQHPAISQYTEHINPAFVRLLGTLGYGRVFVRGDGTRLFDHAGREYLDCLAGFGTCNLGHSPPALVAALHAALDRQAVNVLHIGPQPLAGALAEALSACAPDLSMCLFSSTGGEAIEAAMKLARAATGRAGILYCTGGFHGTGLGALSVMGTPRLREPFEPLLPACHALPFGDLDALQEALVAHRPAGFVVEPIQGEGGVVIPPTGYLHEAQRLCRKHGTLLILDEIQTGMGRTGRLFASQHDGLTPDVLCLGKALGGSLLALSATLTRKDIQRRAYGSMERFDLHGSTFSGNALACAVGLATLTEVNQPAFLSAVQERGARLLTALRARLLGHPFVRDIRGSGLLIGIELGPTDRGLWNRLLPGLVAQVSRRVVGQWLSLRLLESGIVLQPASQAWNVLKLTPPLTIEPAEIDRVVETLASLLATYQDLSSVVRDATARVGRQALADWQF